MRIVAVGNGRSVHAVGRSAAVAARGHAVRFVTIGPALAAPGLEVRTREIPHSASDALRAARTFVADVRTFHPDLLHLHYAGGRLGTLATLPGIRPLVVTVMGGDVLAEQHAGGLSALERRATRRILAQADLILVKSDALRPALRALTPEGARVETVRWGIDPARFHPDPDEAAALREELGLPATARVVLSPRSLQPLYNITLIVQAMAEVVRRVPEAVLLLTEAGGDAAYRTGVEEQVETLGLGASVRFVGALPHDRMRAFFSLAEAAVSIPSSDGLPQSLFEAMACGCPMVLGRLPGYGEVVDDGDTALLADFAPPSVAAALVRLLTDAGLRQALAAAARARVERVALLPREVARVEALYAEVVAAPRRREPLAFRALDALTLVAR